MKQYLDRDVIKYFIVLLLAAFLAIDHQYSLSATQSQWQLLSALCLALITVGENFSERVAFILFSGLIAAILVFVAGFMSFSFYLQAIYLAIITFIAVYLGQWHANFFLPAFIVNLFALLVSVAPANLIESSQRSLAIVIGCIIIAFLQIIFALHFKTNLRARKFYLSVENLQTLNNEIFNCLLQEDYTDNLYLYERRIHIAKINFIYSYEKLRGSTFDHKNHTLATEHLPDVYLELMDCAQLRLRVSDHTTFNLCKNDFIRINQILNDKFAALKAHILNKKDVRDTEDLSFAIAQLEEVVATVLQIAAREPLVFYLFTSSLKKYAEGLEQLLLLTAKRS